MCGSFLGGVAQTVEQVNHNHSVGGSSPSAATMFNKDLRDLFDDLQNAL